MRVSFANKQQQKQDLAINRKRNTTERKNEERSIFFPHTHKTQTKQETRQNTQQSTVENKSCIEVEK